MYAGGPPWIDNDNKKQIFCLFAKQGKFDPLVADNWYTITKADILQIKVCLQKY